MYRECRYVHASGCRCDRPALNNSNWCYFHTRVQERQTFRHKHRAPDGRFAALPAPGQSTEQPEANTETVDHGVYPVAAAIKPGAPSPSLEIPENSTLDLPSLEDPVSIQLALIDVAQALAANRIDTKRAGLLLYALQVASANTRQMHFSRFDCVRTVTYDEAGLPLAPEQAGQDTKDINEQIRRKENDRAQTSASKADATLAKLLLGAKLG
jgi:hypothetical protein